MNMGGDTDNNELDLLKFTHEKLEKRFQWELEWVNDVERKAISITSVNGVILALEVPLVPLIHSLIEEKISVSGLVLFPVGLVLSLVVMIFVGQIILFLLSIYYAYAGHKVTSYVVPSTKPLLDTCKTCQDKPKPMSEVLKQEIVELENSLNSVRRNLDEKSKYVKKSQAYLIYGIIVLTALLLLMYLSFTPI